MSCFSVAAAQYPIDRLSSWEDYVAKLSRWIDGAVGSGSKLLVFPEYAAMELASLDPATMGDLAGSLTFVSSLAAKVDGFHRETAMRLGVHIVAASLPVADRAGRVVNRARLFAPSGKVGVQDKLVMTRFEREQWTVSAGAALRVFDTELGRIGINICYDSEFPLLARAQVEAGAHVIVVPSCTDSLQGYWRVRLGCQARALEGQCYVVQSPTVGMADWSPAVDVNRGAAGVFAPPDGAFPDDGVVALGDCDMPQWVLADIDTARVDALRAAGGVLNTRHWPEQPGASPLPGVEVVSLLE